MFIASAPGVIRWNSISLIEQKISSHLIRRFPLKDNCWTVIAVHWNCHVFVSLSRWINVIYSGQMKTESIYFGTVRNWRRIGWKFKRKNLTYKLLKITLRYVTLRSKFRYNLVYLSKIESCLWFLSGLFPIFPLQYIRK
jgi:hypothetical protein